MEDVLAEDNRIQMPENLTVEDVRLTIALVRVRCNLCVWDVEKFGEFINYLGRIDGSIVGVDLLAQGVISEDL